METNECNVETFCYTRVINDDLILDCNKQIFFTNDYKFNEESSIIIFNVTSIIFMLLLSILIFTIFFAKLLYSEENENYTKYIVAIVLELLIFSITIIALSLTCLYHIDIFYIIFIIYSITQIFCIICIIIYNYNNIESK